MRRPGRWRRFVVRPLVWALALVALVALGVRLFVGSDLARSRARALIEARLGEAFGRPVTVGGLDFDLMPFSVVATGVVVPGDREGAADFARVERIEIEADLEGWRRSVIELRRVHVRGARVVLELREDGDNLPRFRGKGGDRRALTVRVDGLTIEDGRVTVDERTAPVEVDARAVLARFAGLGGTDLEGVVTAQEVALSLPGAQPVSFALSAKARLLADHLEFSNARLVAPDFAARASGQVRWRGGTSVDLTASLDASGSFLDRLGYLDGDLAGPFHAEGTFGWRRAGWGWRADVESPGLDVFGFRLEQLAGEARGGRDEGRFELERGEFARDLGEVAGLALGLHRLLPQHVALMRPVLFHELGAAGPDQLGALQV
ncbi:MAG: AsmA-like C-terminal region-containing protein, partial [Thermoanaerobaculia bacterium]